MKLKSWVYAIGAFVLLFQGIAPGSTAALDKRILYTLEESVEEALANNRSIKAREEKIQGATYAREQARADFYPKLSTSYGYTRLDVVRKSSPISLGPLGTIPASDLNTRDNYRWKATVTQPLFTGHALTSAYELAKLGIDQSRLDLELGRLDLTLRVKEAYFNILIAEKSLDVVGKEVESLQSNVKVASSFYKVGMIPVNDLLKAEVELANAQQNLVRARNALKLTRSAFNIELSKPVNDPVEVEDILVYTSEAGDFDADLKRALENRPEIKAVDVNVLQVEQRVRLAKSKYYPELALSYDYIREGDDLSVSGSPFHEGNQWQVTAGLTWTFWEWGKTDNAVREQESLKKQLLQTRAFLVDNIGLEIERAILDLDIAAKNIPTTQKAVEQAEENLRVNEERYKAQVTTISEVLDAQALLTRARVNHYRALYDHNLARARLERAVGVF